MKPQRIAWLDVAKAIGIYAIYLGHFGDAAGPAYKFVFQFHVPLFFFLAGCTEHFGKENDWRAEIVKNMQRVLIPAYIFALLSLGLHIINANADLSEVKGWLRLIAQGLIRNNYLAASLWFLTCLFVMKLLFMLIKRMRKWYLILAAGALLFLVAEYKITPRPAEVPHWFYNLDSAFYYMHYYISGFLVFPAVNKFLENKTLRSRIGKWILGCITVGYTVLMYFQINLLTVIPAANKVLNSLLRLGKAYLIIGAIIIISYCFQNMQTLNEIGQNTLYLCGGEYIIKILVPSVIGLLGLSLNLDGPLYISLYTGILLWISMRTVVPVLKETVEIICRGREGCNSVR